MSCQPSNALDICPTADDIIPQILALLPPGRAWGTHDGGPWPGSVLYGFWYAVATVWAWVNAAICSLVPEFSCRTATLTRDTWMEEYGLPDGCDPFPDLCTKVAAVGGAHCDYYQTIAARAGWAIACTDVNTSCSIKAGGRARAGGAPVGKGLRPAVLLITVTLSASPAYTAVPNGSTGGHIGLAPPLAGRMQAGGALACQPAGPLVPPFAGALQAGGRLACPIDLSALECLLTRIVGAHNFLIFETTP